MAQGSQKNEVATLQTKASSGQYVYSYNVDTFILY